MIEDRINIGTKPTVILDLGRAFIKCGFSGESAPKYMFPSPLDQWILTALEHGWDRSQWLDVLGPFLADIYNQYLRCRAKDRRVLICEPLVGPAALREALVHALYHYLRVPALLLVPSLHTPLHTTGSEGGLVVDVGYRETHAVAIAFGQAIHSTYHTAGIGSHAFLERLRQLMEQPDMDLATAQDIAVRVCFVASRGSDTMPVNDVAYRDGLVIPHEVRSRAAEVLFNDDEDVGSVPVAVLECLKKCPRDVRRLVAGHVVVVGGAAMLPGFCRRLNDDIRYLAESMSRYRELVPVVQKECLCVVKESLCPRNIITWVGGSILAAVEDTIDLGLFTTRAAYLSGDKTFDDWLCVSPAHPTE